MRKNNIENSEVASAILEYEELELERQNVLYNILIPDMLNEFREFLFKKEIEKIEEYAQKLYDLTFEIVEYNKREGILREDCEVVREIVGGWLPVLSLKTPSVSLRIGGLVFGSAIFECLAERDLFERFFFTDYKRQEIFMDSFEKKHSDAINKELNVIQSVNKLIDPSETPYLKTSRAVRGIVDCTLGVFDFTLYDDIGSKFLADLERKDFTEINNNPTKYFKMLKLYSSYYSKSFTDPGPIGIRLKTGRSKKDEIYIKDLDIPTNTVEVGPFYLSATKPCLNTQLVLDVFSIFNTAPLVPLYIPSYLLDHDISDNILYNTLYGQTSYSFTDGGVENKLLKMKNITLQLRVYDDTDMDPYYFREETD